jgi:16S rRNA (uracil1498-N3)-methyltransferase
MPENRFFVDSISSQVKLEGNEFHHLAHVMRLSPGDLLELVDGKGTLAEGRLLHIHSTYADIAITLSHTEPPPTTTLTLALGLTRPSVLEWTVEKATELGATHLLLFPASKSEKISPRLPRLHQLILSALKQCGRLHLPTLEFRPPLSAWEPPAGTLFFGDTSPNAPRLKGPFDSSVTFFIGPEGGFSPAELEILQKFKAQGIKLHDNILRAETAAVAALSQYFTAL